MEPRKEQPKKIAERGKEDKKKRFQLIKLEERIAPDKGGTTNGPHGCWNWSGQICKACF
jgi:hypothetical protein